MKRAVAAYPSLVACALLLWAAGLPSSATAQAAAAPAPSRPLGIYVFLSSQGDVQPVLTPEELRGTVETNLTSVFAERSIVAGTAALEPLIGKHRVRTSMLADAAFFSDLASEVGLAAVALVDVIILPDNIVLAVREVAVPSGLLQSAQWAVAQVATSRNREIDTTAAEGWRANLARLCAAIVPDERPVPSGRPLAVLPFAQQGADAVAALVASLMLFQNILAEGTVPLPDPSLLVTTLQGAGLEAHLLNSESRALIGERFGCELLLHPLMLSYAPRARGVQTDIPDFSGTVHENILLASGELTLLAVDLADGLVARGAAVYFELRQETGWFGIPDERTPVIQLEAAIGGLWRSFYTQQEES